MRLPRFLPLLLMTLALSASSCFQRSRPHAIQVKVERSDQYSVAAIERHRQPININTATARELESLPGIGKSLAERIIEHREKYGPFRRPEHLIIVRGISDKRFRTLREFISVE